MIPASIFLFRMGGVPVRMHITLPFLVLALLIRSGFTAWNLWFILALFGSILLHEYGHVVAAARFGIQTREMLLHPMGGLAILSRAPAARQQVAVSLAGPAVNFLLAALLYLLVDKRMYDTTTWFEVSRGSFFLDAVWRVNLWLGLFNLIPAYPLDGGQTLRGLLEPVYGAPRARKLTADIGQVLGFAMVLWGFVGGNVLLTFVGLFVMFTCVQESGWVNPKAWGLFRRDQRTSKRGREDDYRGLDSERRLEAEAERRRLKELFERSFREEDEQK